MKYSSVIIRCLAWAAIIVISNSICVAREIHVAKNGSDSNPGDRQTPYLTIDKAAHVAQPGDIVVVHAGTYREWVKPVRGGTSEADRITYRAAPGDEVIVKGSECVDGWVRESGDVWKLVLPNTFFGDYNPYALQVSGGWLNYGQWHHRGDVYLNGKALLEKKTSEELQDASHTWHCAVDDKSTTIRANFGSADPNAEQAEINVRESLFMPEKTGLSYITIDGFQFMHAAANWAPPAIELQTGAVGPRMGKRWIIENCLVSDIRCVGIILGRAPGANYEDIDSFGDHIVRNNIIRRCGQAGIAGQRGAARCFIWGNLIEETNYRREFGGWETAAIKFHQSVDTVIRGNLIRGVYHQIQGAFGIWMDFGNQGTRISGNVIYNTQAAGVFLEMNHGPILVDNNIIVGGGFRSNSENTVVAHNLLVDFDCKYVKDIKRRSQYYTPHTTLVAGVKTGVPENDKWFNNIFIRTGLSNVQQAPGFVSDYNVFLEGAEPSSFGDLHSVVDRFETGFQIEEYPLGVTVRFALNGAPRQVQPPCVDAQLVGVFPTANQTLEDRFGNPIRVDTDIQGQKRERHCVGPLAKPEQGINEVIWKAEARWGTFEK
jgi:alpha-N-arabinofuranosidase